MQDFECTPLMQSWSDDDIKKVIKANEDLGNLVPAVVETMPQGDMASAFIYWTASILYGCSFDCGRVGVVASLRHFEGGGELSCIW